MIKKDWRFKKNQTIKCFQNFLFGLNWKIVHTRVLKVHLISKTLSIEPNKKLPFCAAKPYKPDYTVVTARAPVPHLLLLLPTKCHMLLPQHQVKEMNHRRSGRSFFCCFRFHLLGLYLYSGAFYIFRLQPFFLISYVWLLFEREPQNVKPSHFFCTWFWGFFLCTFFKPYCTFFSVRIWILRLVFDSYNWIRLHFDAF